MGRYCPSTYAATLQRIQSLGCDQRYRYHCLRNKKDEMLEKCMEISWIQEGHCAVFDTDAQTIDAWKCHIARGICPQKQYLSNDVMSYSACVPQKTSNITIWSDSNTSDSPIGGSSSNQRNDTLLVLGIAAVLLILLVVLGSLGVFLYRRRKRAFHANYVKDGGDALSDFEEKENMPLTTSSVSNENCHGSRSREMKKYDDSPYYKTKTYEHIENLVKNSPVGILILGKPGSGKSVLAEMLYERFRLGNDTHCTAKLLRNLKTIDGHPRYKNSKMIFIIDDCFEDWIQYPHLVSTSLEQLQSVHKSIVEDEANCLVLTISKNNFENSLDSVQKLIFEKMIIIDLSLKKFDLDITDKTGILENRRIKKGWKAARMEDKNLRKLTDPGVIQSVASYVRDKVTESGFVKSLASYYSESNIEFEFPLLCNLFYLHDSFEAKQEDFFNRTRSIILEYVRGLRDGSEEQKCQYCTLMYVVLHGGQVYAPMTQGKYLLEDIASARGMNVTEFKLKFDYGCCFIKEEKDKMYKIVHEEITKLLFVSFGYVHIGLVIAKCDLNVLLKFLRTDDTKRREGYREQGLLVITYNMNELLAARLQDTNETYEKHVIFQDEKFRKRFKKVKLGTISGVV